MSDYIRREDAIKAVHEEFDDCVVWDESGERTADEVESIIDCVLSADVAPVVFCKDCPYYKSGNSQCILDLMRDALKWLDVFEETGGNMICHK